MQKLSTSSQIKIQHIQSTFKSCSLGQPKIWHIEPADCNSSQVFEQVDHTLQRQEPEASLKDTHQPPVQCMPLVSLINSFPVWSSVQMYNTQSKVQPAIGQIHRP